MSVCVCVVGGGEEGRLCARLLVLHLMEKLKSVPNKCHVYNNIIHIHTRIAINIILRYTTTVDTYSKTPIFACSSWNNFHVLLFSLL